jgi:hypothetical protein
VSTAAEKVVSNWTATQANHRLTIEALQILVIEDPIARAALRRTLSAIDKAMAADESLPRSVTLAGAPA